MVTKSVGKKQIRSTIGRSWEVIMHLAKHEGCPVVKIDGRWELRHDLYDEWDRARHEKLMHVSHPPCQ